MAKHKLNFKVILSFKNLEMDLEMDFSYIIF